MDSGSRRPRSTRSQQEFDAVSRAWRLVAAGWGKAGWRAVVKRALRRRERREPIQREEA